VTYETITEYVPTSKTVPVGGYGAYKNLVDYVA